MRVIGFLRAHLDTVVAVALTIGYLIEISQTDATATGQRFLELLEVDETIAITASVAFLFSLALRSTLPLLPIALAYLALAASGAGAIDSILALALGVVLAAYSVGAWAAGRAGQLGALGVGGLAGLSALRVSSGQPEPRDLVLPVVLLVGAWLVGIAVRSLRAGRGDIRVVGDVDWESGAAAPDSVGRDEVVREIRDVVERSMSAVILQSRTAQATLEREPDQTRESLRIIEAAGTDALTETQRLTSELLSPDGTPLPEPLPGLADLDYLAEQVTAAGLPVDMRVEGRPVPLTPDLDSVAYRVVHQALMNTLESATSAQSSVVIRYEPDELQIEISDDGVSAAGEDVDAETAGLMAVRDEVAAIGGTLDAGPGEDRGYWVLARMPFEPDWE